MQSGEGTTPWHTQGHTGKERFRKKNALTLSRAQQSSSNSTTVESRKGRDDARAGTVGGEAPVGDDVMMGEQRQVRGCRWWDIGGGPGCGSAAAAGRVWAHMWGGAGAALGNGDGGVVLQ